MKMVLRKFMFLNLKRKRTDCSRDFLYVKDNLMALMVEYNLRQKATT